MLPWNYDKPQIQPYFQDKPETNRAESGRLKMETVEEKEATRNGRRKSRTNL